MDNNQIHRNYESETDAPYQRPPIVPLPGMGRCYWRMVSVASAVAVVWIGIALWILTR